MKKRNKKKRIPPSVKSLYPLLILICCIFMSIGYATMDSISLKIEGDAIALEQEGVFIIEATQKESSGADIIKSNINKASGTILNSTIALSETDSSSYITYTITMLNNYNYKTQFNSASFDSNFYDNSNIIFEISGINPGDVIDSGGYATFDITFKYKDGVTPSSSINILNSYVNFNISPIAMLRSVSASSSNDFRTSSYLSSIKIINFENKIEEPREVIESWDMGTSQTGDVMAYLTPNQNDSTYYDLHIQSNQKLYANPNMASWFSSLKYLDEINGIELMDTSLTTNMSGMFRETGYHSKTFTLDVSSFNTSKVTDMSYMFHQTGCSSLVFTLDLKNFDTSKVTNMSGMFRYAGHYSTEYILDISSFNTSNVYNMSGMFYGMGSSSKVLTMDLSNFDTSNVTNMAEMFYQTGKSSPVFELNISSFNTSKVTDMQGMFYGAGYSSTVLTLDVSKFDTSKVTNMSDMFNSAGYSNSNFTLDVSNFNTSKVIYMNSMFYQTGYKSTIFKLNVSNFDTSNVTNMMHMFSKTGYMSPVFSIDVSNFNTSKVTNMNHTFASAGYSNPNFELDVSNFDTSKVTHMGGMFNLTGYINPNFTLDVSNFDTSNVTNMSYMFSGAGRNSSKFRTSITVSNPNVASYDNMFLNTALLTGSQIIVKYTEETSDLVDLMVATKTEGANVIKWYSSDVGTEISIGEEKFNVISDDGETITLFAKYNVGTDYKQTTTTNHIKFTSTYGWDYTPGPKEIDIQVWTVEPKNYVNGYVDYLKGLTGSTNLTGTLITGTQLIGLGCSFNSSYAFSTTNRTCNNSPHISWLNNGQNWWTKSASSNYYNSIWHIRTDGYFYDALSASCGIRPVITIDKITLAKYL